MLLEILKPVKFLTLELLLMSPITDRESLLLTRFPTSVASLGKNIDVSLACSVSALALN